MQPERQTISGKVNAGILDKADRLFRNDDAGVWTEILQNARRAGATRLDVSIEEVSPDVGPSMITVADNGCGIENFQSLLTLGASHWNDETQGREDPAGMGFFSLCRCEVEVHSGNRQATITPSVFMGKCEAEVIESDEFVTGTRLRFAREAAKSALIQALERASEFCPLDVRLEGRLLPRHDFLDGALYRETIDGIEVGFSTQFSWGWHQYNDSNWNFYGLRIADTFDQFTGLLKPGERPSPLTLHARFNVLDTGRVKLQLPDRRAMIQDEFLSAFHRKARAAAYRFFQTQDRHALPSRNWREAKDLGIALPEAACLLETWHADPMDENTDPVFGYGEQRLLADASNVILLDRDIPDAHTLEAALYSGAKMGRELYRDESQYEGYSWYDSLPRIIKTSILMDDVPWEERPSVETVRPARIEVELRIEEAGRADRTERLPALIHVDSSCPNELSFTAVRQSPWDNDELQGPFSISDFLLAATFCASDDVESDSWNTQREAYEDAIEREVNSYFRGPRASLTAILRKAVGWDASRLAEQIGIKEIRFKRTANGRMGWDAELLD
jgi:hypothetical protein